MRWVRSAVMDISETVAAELTDSLKGGVTVRAMLEMPTLLDLHIVRAKSLSDEAVDLAPTALGLLKEAAVRVDESSDGATATLIGIAMGSKGLNLTERRTEAASLLSVNPDHLRKHLEADRIQALADEVASMDSTFQARLGHKLSRPAAPESRLRIDWLARHEAYRRIWTPVSAMRGDLLVLLGYVNGSAQHHDMVDRVMNILWRRAQYTSAVEQFIDEYGGLWLLANPNKESQAAEAVHQLGRQAPGGENDDSWLRLKLAESREQELDGFGDLVWQSEQGKETVQVWLDWAKSCRCDLGPDGEPRSTCAVHNWLAACDSYIHLIDEDWDEIADWYRQERSPNHLRLALKPDHGDDAVINSGM